MCVSIESDGQLRVGLATAFHISNEIRSHSYVKGMSKAGDGDTDMKYFEIMHFEGSRKKVMQNIRRPC